jgi:hypothetical protein
MQYQHQHTSAPLLITFLLAVLALCPAACSDQPPAPVEPELPPTQPLDTISHDFVWEYDTVGIQFCTIAGVAPDDIWVAGKFYLNDSLGNPVIVPVGNAAHWNGVEWTFHGFNSSGKTSWYNLDDAAAFGPDNIWICGGSPFRWDGARWKTYDYDGFYFNSGINAIWSTPDQKHVCAVGYERSCVLYSAADDAFHWVDIPRDEHCYSVTGTDDGTMYIAAGNPDNGEGHVYKISPEGELSTYVRCPYGPVLNAWMLNDTLYVSSRDAIFKLADVKYDRFLHVKYASSLIHDVAVEAPNNIVATTGTNSFLHYNGANWVEIPFEYPKSVFPHDLSVVGRHIYIVGYTPEQYCLIMHGTRVGK